MRFIAAAGILAIALPAASQDGQKSDPTREAYAAKLKTLRVTIDFKQAPIEDVINYLREVADINMFVGSKVKERGAVDITLKVADLPLRAVLNLMLAPHKLAYGYKDGVLMIMTEEEKQSDVVMEIYDVRDVLYPIRMFPGVDMSLATDALGGVVAGDEESSGEELPIVDLIKAHTGGKTWDDNPKAAINLQNGLLVVKQTKEVHGQIHRLIGKLRQFK